LDVDGETAASRLNDELDRMELKGNEFHEKVRAGFLDQVRIHSDRYCMIDATQDVETVGIEIRGVIQKWFVSINSA
jgi:dTMP kinase